MEIKRAAKILGVTEKELKHYVIAGAPAFYNRGAARVEVDVEQIRRWLEWKKEHK